MNLFFVSSPFQLINAMEAISYYKCKNNILILREQENILAESHIDNIIEYNDWDTIIRLPKKSKPSIYPRLVSLLKKIKKINPSMSFTNVFYAEYPTRRISTLLGNISITEKEVMFDDGVWTITEYKDNISTKNRIIHDNFKRSTLLKIFGFNSPRTVYPRKNFEIFTFFDLPESSINIKINTFHRLKLKINHTQEKSNNLIVFIGDGLTGNGLNIESYLKSLKSILNKHDNCKLLYFPHRNEKENIKIQLLKNIPELTYVNASLPIELELSNHQGINSIYGYYSTALLSLSKLYPDIPIFTRTLSENEFSDQDRLANINYICEHFLISENIKQWAP